MTIKDKVVVITGASSGIGAATAQLLVERGAKVVLGARRQSKLAAVAKQFPQEQVCYQMTDVAQLSDVKDLINLAQDKFGKIDALYNNAGIMPTANLDQLHHDEWQAMLQINIMGVLNGIEAVLPIMQKQGYGHILATDSVAGHLVYPGSAVYCGTKFAVRAIMEGLRQEQKENGIRSTIVSPGSVNTELYKSISDPQAAQDLVESWQQPNNSLNPIDVAAAVVYAIGTPAHVSVSEILIRPTGQEL